MVWLSSALGFANAIIYPTSVLAWGGAFGNYLTGQTGYLTLLIKPVGVVALLLASALVFAIVVYNISFDFILNAFNRMNKTPAKSVAPVAGASTTAPVFRDTDENIFAKDNIAEGVQPIKLELEKEPTMEMEVINTNDDEPLEELAGDEGLELEVAKVPEEAMVDENTGSLETNYDPTLDLSNYKFPGLELLEEYGSDKVKIDAEELERNKNQIISTLNNYQIEISKIKATIGPTVTLYEIVPAPGVRISKIKNLEDDIALSLAALGIRIIAPIPGKGTIGIEVPNAHKEIVSMRSLLA
jgi:S-DNA-T family DNA segregation ATPase FtsK/SpoIIIE